MGLLADIHEAVEPLREALALFRRRGVERVVHLGDICARHRRLDEVRSGMPAPVRPDARKKVTQGLTVVLCGPAPATAHERPSCVGDAWRVVAHYYERGLLHSRQGSHDLAIADFTEAIRLDRRWGLPYTARGAAYIALGRHQAAIDDLDKAVQYNRDHALSHFLRAQAHEKLGNLEAARADSELARKLDPGVADAKARTLHRPWVFTASHLSKEEAPGGGTGMKSTTRGA
jgi:tetratricopeptide (TPR) repeat protein